MLYFTEDHQYIRLDGNFACLGISDYLSAEFDRILSFKSREFGEKIAVGDQIALLGFADHVVRFESWIDGEVIELNTILEKNPALISSSPEGEGWFLKLRINCWPDTSEWMNRRQYLARYL